MDKYDAALKLMRARKADPKAARGLLDEAIAEGDPRACYALATWYLHGTYVRKSFKEGVRLLKIAADRKVRDALFDLAVAYERGRGISKDLEKAFNLYREAADLGDPEAMSEVGRMFYHGIGVREDREAADRWMERAASATSETHQPQQMAS